MKQKGHRGFTALELIVTMAVIAILLTTGVPAFRDYSWNLRMKVAMDNLRSDLNLARGKAISHNIQTVICPSINNDECSGQSAWQDGWIVFSDLNADHRKQDTEPLLKQAAAIAMLNINSSRSRNYLRFYPNGSAPGSNVSITFCDRRGAEQAGTITVSNSGRIRMQTGDTDPSENCP
jgi:type IV fimbrial biogenesis protein FimT